MQHRFFLILFSLSVYSGVYAQNRQIDSLKLRNLEFDWHNAYVQHNIKLIENVLADDFIDIGRTGNRITKKQVLENFTKDSSVYEVCEPFDMEFRIYPSSAIVIGKTREKGKLDNKEFENIYFWHDVFVKTKNGWKCAMASVALIPPKK